MSDFMMSQVQGLLSKVADDIDRMNQTSTSQSEMVLGAIDDLAANIFATQAILAVMLKDNPVDAKKAKEWITSQTAGPNDAPKALAMVDLLLSGKK